MEPLLEPAPLTVTRYPAGSQIVFSGPLVAGNTVALTVINTPLTVAWAGTSAATMAALAVAIAAVAGVASAVVNGTNPQRIDAMPGTLGLSGAVVTGGASQATIALSGGHFGGEFVPPLATTLTVNASVQPLRGIELLNFPEGERTKGIIRLWADAALQTADEATGVAADLVAYGGARYKVTRVMAWPGELGHWEVTAVRMLEP